MNMLTEKLLCFYQTIFAICLQGQIYVASSIRVTMFCVFCVLFSFVVFVCLIVSLFVCLFCFVCFFVFVFVFLFLFWFMFFICFVFCAFSHAPTHIPSTPSPPHTHNCGFQVWWISMYMLCNIFPAWWYIYYICLVDCTCGECLCICSVVVSQCGWYLSLLIMCAFSL